jgi:hypothetical protein
MGKIAGNNLCSCGSGKKYKNCCMKKKMTYERYQRMNYSVENVPFQKLKIVIYSDNTTALGVKLINENRKEIKTSLKEIQGLYRRENKPDKMLYTQPINDNFIIDSNVELAKYDMLLVVDTSYDPYLNPKMAFTSILTCLKEYETKNAYGYKIIPHLLEWDATQCSQIENYMYAYSIEFLRTKYNENNALLKTAVIIDSCLESIPSYNEKKEAIFENYYLPDGFFIFYASDKGDMLQNKLLKTCDSQAKGALRQYKEKIASKSHNSNI